MSYGFKISYFSSTYCPSNLGNCLRGLASVCLKLDEIYPTLKVYCTDSVKKCCWCWCI